MSLRIFYHENIAHFSIANFEAKLISHHFHSKLLIFYSKLLNQTNTDLKSFSVLTFRFVVCLDSKHVIAQYFLLRMPESKKREVKILEKNKISIY